MIIIKLTDIRPYEHNPRINEHAVNAVAESIKQFGFKQPIVVDKDNVIIVGHTRYKAAQLLGLEDVPVIVADDLSEEKVKAYRLADNKTGELAEWDFALLEQELAELSEMDFDMLEFGFEEESEARTKTKTYTNEELSEEEFDEENYNHECPRCGFVWNDKQ